MDSRTSTVVQIRGVSTTEEHEGWRMVGGCEGDGAGLPRTDLRAVAVAGEFCVIKNRL